MSCGYIVNVDCLATIFMLKNRKIFNTAMQYVTADDLPIENFFDNR
jgi:hypothetical protein